VCAVAYDPLTSTDVYVYWSLMASQTTRRKYEVTVPTNAVRDLLINYPSAALTTSWVTAGSLDADSERPSVRTGGYNPALDATVGVSSNVVLHFNEDVQKGFPGYGPPTVYWCLNSDATSNTTCDAGRFQDNTTASYEITSADITDRRTLTINPGKNFAIGQKLYVLMPESTVVDCSNEQAAMEAIKESAYSFTVVDEDTVNMHLDWYHTSTLHHMSLQILFSEAVQGGGGGISVDEAGGASGISGVSSSISGNLVTISRTSWTAGKKYTLNLPVNAFRDLKGNPSDAYNAPTGVTFAINADGTPPTGTIHPSAFQTAFDTYDSLTIEFNEVVQAGTGKVSIFSGSSDTVIDSIDATELSLVSFVKDSKRISTVQVPITWGASVTPPECGTTFKFQVDSTAFYDLADNAYTAYSSKTTATSNNLHDVTAPKLTSVDLGDGPNPAFSGSSLVMYFTEVVQSGGAGTSVYLASSLGGNFCGPSVGGACPLNETASCNLFCDYDNSTTTSVTLSTLTFSGAKVTAAVPATIETGKGYKLMIDAGKFKDVIGNTISAVDGEENSIGAFTFQVGSSSTSSSDTTAPVYNNVFPEGNTNMVAPSTTVQLTFQEIVQAGTGTLSIGTATVAASDCYYQAQTVTCKPDGDLDMNTEYSVAYTGGLVKDAAGNSVAASTFVTDFTTINLDYNPATPPTAGTGYEPANLDDIMPKGTVVALSFAETVQAGTGSVNVGSKAVSVTSSSATFIDKMVYVMPDLLVAGAAHTVTADAGAIRTTSGTSVALTSYTFNVVPDDVTEPAVLLTVPENEASMAAGTVGVEAVTADIMLYFSEAVQAVAAQVITVEDGATSSAYAIPLDNTNPAMGEVFVLDPGSLVFIDPFDDMSYDSTVTVTASAGTFQDYFDVGMREIGTAPPAGFTKSNSALGAAGTYQYKTVSSGFANIKTNNATVGFSARYGAISYYTNSSLMLYSGKGAVCLSDLWTSSTGTTWSQVTGVTTTDGSPAPMAANAPTAIDANGCVWLLGGECNSYAGTIWKSCTMGKTWEPMPSPTSVPFAGSVAFPPAFPTSWSGHAIAIVGGWQLVIVQASADGGVWRFTTGTLELVQLVATAPLPFGIRNDPKLLTTSDSKLYLLGGHTCSDKQCTNNEVLRQLGP
jgi:hypothetical protein